MAWQWRPPVPLVPPVLTASSDPPLYVVAAGYVAATQQEREALRAAVQRCMPEGVPIVIAQSPRLVRVVTPPLVQSVFVFGIALAPLPTSTPHAAVQAAAACVARNATWAVWPTGAVTVVEPALTNERRGRYATGYDSASDTEDDGAPPNVSSLSQHQTGTWRSQRRNRFSIAAAASRN